MQRLQQYLIDNNLPCDATTLDKFDKFYQLLVEWNAKFNLTAITDSEGVELKHFIDSLASASLIKENATVVDIGSGAGFPGIPLAIVRPDIAFDLVDSLNKRVNFLSVVKDALSLDNITLHHSRAEDFAIKHRDSYDIAIARAVAPLNILLEYLAPFVKIGGKVIAYKGASTLEELDAAKNAIDILSLQALPPIEYALPQLDDKRYLVVFDKIRRGNIMYPRGGNRPRTQPL